MRFLDYRNSTLSCLQLYPQDPLRRELPDRTEVLLRMLPATVTNALRGRSNNEQAQ